MNQEECPKSGQNYVPTAPFVSVSVILFFFLPPPPVCMYVCICVCVYVWGIVFKKLEIGSKFDRMEDVHTGKIAA